LPVHPSRSPARVPRRPIRPPSGAAWERSGLRSVFWYGKRETRSGLATRRPPFRAAPPRRGGN
jgi:hypothetical protein